MTTGLPLKLSATIGTEKYSFLLDTGSSVSLLPYNNIYSILRPATITLSNASGDQIKCYGELDAQVGIPALRRNFTMTFLIAEVSTPILGTDFLSQHSLLVDCKNNCIIDSITNLKVNVSPDNNFNVNSYYIDISHVEERGREILSKYPLLTAPLNCIIVKLLLLVYTIQLILKIILQYIRNLVL